ncbi:MAG: hypothetical protein IJL54_06385 [Prevotella sp.]|nr:hypothetical protein [Prevotella sp.]
MKAILYNRFCHWGWAETPDTFRSWYDSIDYTNVGGRDDIRQSKVKYNPLLIGAVIGDIVGSIYEFNPHKSKDISLQHLHATEQEKSYQDHAHEEAQAYRKII